MRRIFKHKTIVLSFTLLILFCGCASEWQKYNNREYGFSLLLPSSWEKKEGAMKSVLMVLAPVQKKSAAKGRPNINIFVTELPEEVKLDVIFELNKEELTKSGIMMDKFTEGEIYAGTLAGKWLSFEGLMQDYRLKIMSAIWVKGRKVYTITCSSMSEEFNEYSPVFNKIMRSLRVK